MDTSSFYGQWFGSPASKFSLRLTLIYYGHQVHVYIKLYSTCSVAPTASILMGFDYVFQIVNSYLVWGGISLYYAEVIIII